MSFLTRGIYIGLCFATTLLGVDCLASSIEVSYQFETSHCEDQGNGQVVCGQMETKPLRTQRLELKAPPYECVKLFERQMRNNLADDEMGACVFDLIDIHGTTQVIAIEVIQSSSANTGSKAKWQVYMVGYRLGEDHSSAHSLVNVASLDLLGSMTLSLPDQVIDAKHFHMPFLHIREIREISE